MVPSESAPRKSFPMNGQCQYVSTILNSLGNFCVPPLLTEVTISPYRVNLRQNFLVEIHVYLWLAGKTRRTSLGLVLSYDQKKLNFFFNYFLIFFLGMGTLVGCGGPGDVVGHWPAFEVKFHRYFSYFTKNCSYKKWPDHWHSTCCISGLNRNIIII
jgi:hypothetical protein